jgi:hypothetical protein
MGEDVALIADGATPKAELTTVLVKADDSSLELEGSSQYPIVTDYNPKNG